MSRVFVGNDVVDLTNPRTEGRGTDDRFVGRVFDEDEQDAIRRAGFTDLELWSRWAAKEAGFKAFSKALGAPPPFVHRAFKVTWNALGSAPNGLVARRGEVRYGELAGFVTVEQHEGAVHAVSYCAGQRSGSVVIDPYIALLDTPGSTWAGSLAELRARFTPREVDAVYSLESAAVRVGARGHLAMRLGVDESRLEIVCPPGPTSQRPPRVLLDGEEAPADVSLSHDGRWIAWAIWIAPNAQEVQ